MECGICTITQALFSVGVVLKGTAPSQRTLQEMLQEGCVTIEMWAETGGTLNTHFFTLSVWSMFFFFFPPAITTPPLLTPAMEVDIKYIGVKMIWGLSL